ncbi:uncharacterized protein LOC117781927 [Drosophila innubila]|uniref:uncharacterized protein LOC117781927 n=1 Tax=Drosophila innubila TaxID=198719 RepID=UPI00148B391E|nr:uncharacterized protein LOC117781927 [Drosophila innubila]
MSLSTALIPQQRQPCNRQTARIFARIFEQRHGYWSFMKNRSISRNSSAVVEHQANGILRCVGQVGSSLQTQKSPSFLALQRQKLLALSTEDYRIYPQSVDLDAFFGEEQKCEKVSDVCLLNDHFILVKMPNAEERHVSKSPPPSTDTHSKFGSKLPRCFKCNRGSRVSPILEELEDKQPTPMISPWTSSDDQDVEIFASRTRIISSQSQHQMQAIAVPASRSLQETVIVEQPQLLRKSPETSLQLQLETLQSPPPLQADAYPISRGPLHWFLWPFRRRSASRTKAQLAAVHKTYFVRWNKPPDTLWHGYGVERTEGDKVGLRRCRSAIF